jgi:hypothetical protein
MLGAHRGPSEGEGENVTGRWVVICGTLVLCASVLVGGVATTGAGAAAAGFSREKCAVLKNAPEVAACEQGVSICGSAIVPKSRDTSCLAFVAQCRAEEIAGSSIVATCMVEADLEYGGADSVARKDHLFP